MEVIKMNSAKIKREVIGLALLADEVTDLLIFVNYSPHVKRLSVRIFDDKEAENEVFKGGFYWDFRFPDDEENYRIIKEFLTEEIKKSSEIAL
jgi:hypothetical protein